MTCTFIIPVYNTRLLRKSKTLTLFAIPSGLRGGGGASFKLHVFALTILFGTALVESPIKTIGAWAVMHRVCSLKVEACYLDNAAFLGYFLFGLPSTRSRHCKKSNLNSACTLQQSDSSFTVCPSFQRSTEKNKTLVRRRLKCAGAI